MWRCKLRREWGGGAATRKRHSKLEEGDLDWKEVSEFGVSNEKGWRMWKESSRKFREGKKGKFEFGGKSQQIN